MQPEHFDLASPVFLPVTEETCTALLGADAAKALVGLTDPELAAVLVIQNLAQAAQKDLTCAGAERILAKLLDWSVDTQAEGAATLLSEAQRLFDPRKLYFGFNALKTVNLRLLSAEKSRRGITCCLRVNGISATRSAICAATIPSASRWSRPGTASAGSARPRTSWCGPFAPT